MTSVRIIAESVDWWEPVCELEFQKQQRILPFFVVVDHPFELINDVGVVLSLFIPFLEEVLNPLGPDLHLGVFDAVLVGCFDYAD